MHRMLGKKKKKTSGKSNVRFRFALEVVLPERLFDLLRFILYCFCESWILSCEFTRKRCVYNHGDTYLFRSTYTYTLHLFQLRLLQRRILHDAWSMFHGPRCIIVASQVNYVPATNLNLESKPCWRFYATSAER